MFSEYKVDKKALNKQKIVPDQGHSNKLVITGKSLVRKKWSEQAEETMGDYLCGQVTIVLQKLFCESFLKCWKSESCWKQCGRVTFGSNLIYSFLFCKNRFYTIKVMLSFYHLKNIVLNFGFKNFSHKLEETFWPRCTDGWRGTATTRPTGGTTSRWPSCTPSVEMSGLRWVSQWHPK